jgi:inactivated superfamily I helicase
MLIGAASVTSGQRVTTPEDLKRAMKTIDASLGAALKAIGSQSYADAKPPLTLTRQTLATTRPFWMDRKIDAANNLAKDAIAKLDAVDEALSAANVDGATVSTRLKQVTDACNACHQAYREGDPRSGFRIKAGVPQ